MNQIQLIGHDLKFKNQKIMWMKFDSYLYKHKQNQTMELFHWANSHLNLYSLT